ncbi:MAG: sialidase family protein [Rudaea sp.]
MRPRSLVLCAAFLWPGAASSSSATTIVEYYNATLDHYFITPLANEIVALDSGRIAGWTRTGLVFDAAAAPGPALSPVCRFYIPPEHGDSHFFSASPEECAAVLAKISTDANFSGYAYETPAAFYIALPDTSSGACPAGTLPVYRLWNGRADSNHRYTADAGTRDAMLARGYVAEGYGPRGVAMCTPRAGTGDAQVRVTGRSPYADGCDGAPVTGTVYRGAEVEPQIAVDPQNPSHMIGVWQQDRWSDGGARGLRTGYSFDAGRTWSASAAAFSRCAGGSAANGGDFARASDPWVTIGPDGTAYQIAIAFNGATFASGSSSAVLAARSRDGGRTWSVPATLLRDGSEPFNDKESITADPLAPGYAYAAWDRLAANGHGPAYFARTQDGGATWEAARPLYDPGGRNQTLNNQIVVSTAGGNATLCNFFTQFDVGQNGIVTHRLALVRSADRGTTWSAPIVVSDVRAVGASDPQNAMREVRDAANLGAFASGANGRIVAVWQDARFSAGARDGIAFAHSDDGGRTWSAPVQVNRVPAVQAFLPAAGIADDGTIGVLYYDMRNDTPDPGTLLVDAWLATSKDGATWSERHVAGPIDLTFAPLVEGGLFVGDYHGLAAAGNAFVALIAQANRDANNRSDIVASTFYGVAPAVKATYRARAAPAAAMTPQWQARIDASVAKTLRQRWVGPRPPAPRRMPTLP